ncbi:MAG: PDZ domain-containing protein [Chloroflexi bacterium]|nr:PDZ domain-containing protein [Chloroflexota bacterium]
MSLEVDSVAMLTTFSDAVANTVERVSPSVVRVEARNQRSQGTGVIWDTDGLIVTADHVLERGQDITVTLPDGKSLPATIVGRDPDRDVGLVRVATNGFPSLPRGEPPKVGHLVLAIGRLSERVMATIGLVNAVRGAGRRRGGGASMIQTDALLYPGFSGGPLLDAAGRMVGLNSSRSRAGAGMVVALDSVVETAETLLAGGKVQRGYIGVVTQSVALTQSLREKLGIQQAAALLISGVEPASPADTSGLLLGDVMLTLGDQNLEDGGDLRAILTPERVGERPLVHLIRGGELMDTAVTVGERK